MTPSRSLGLLVVVSVLALATSCTDEGSTSDSSEEASPAIWSPSSLGSPGPLGSPTTTSNPWSELPQPSATIQPPITLTPEPVMAGTDHACPSEVYGTPEHEALCRVLAMAEVPVAGPAADFCTLVVTPPYGLIDRRLWTDTASMEEATRFLTELRAVSPPAVATVTGEMLEASSELSELLRRRDLGEVTDRDVEVFLTTPRQGDPELIPDWLAQVMEICGLTLPPNSSQPVSRRPPA